MYYILNGLTRLFNNAIVCFLFRHKKIALSILKRSKNFQKNIEQSSERELPVTKNSARKRYNYTHMSFIYRISI